MAGQQPPAEQNQKADVTAHVPDDVLCLVFSHISSFRDKFRLAAVNKKFRECMLKEMNRPAPLNVKLRTYDWDRDNLCPSRWRYQFNGTFINSMAPSSLDNAVRALDAAACKFSKITIGIDYANQEYQYALFGILGQTNCLDQVKIFEVEGGGGRSSAFAKAIVRCDQLSVLRLQRINYDPDFTEALKNKRLTELVLSLRIFTHQQVVELFQALKPNLLQKLKLTYVHLVERKGDPLVFSALVKQLKSSWTTVQEICFEGPLLFTDWSQMYEALASLPSLQTCSVKWLSVDRPPEAGAALASLFKLSGVGKNFTFKLNPTDTGTEKGCWFVEVIRQIQKHHRTLQLDLSLSDLKLVFGTVSIVMLLDESRTECLNDGCVSCKHFYPNVIRGLRRKASPNVEVDGHLEDYQLDRCKANKVVEDCNKSKSRWSNKIKATQANEEQDHVTITFEADEQPFDITINTGHCLDNSCIRCVRID